MEPTAVRVDGWRTKIGYINPTTCDYPNNFSRLLPDGAKFVATATGATSFDRDSMADARASRRNAAALLDEWGVDCIIAGGGPVSTLEGVEAEADLIEEIGGTVSVPFTTALQAQVEALRAVDAESIIAVTPFPPERDAETEDYLEGRGFDVVSIGGIDLESPRYVRNLHRSACHQFATELASAAERDFDTVYIACAPFSSAEYIERIEQDVGCPVIGSAQAQMWWAYNTTGINPDLSGYGQLFEAY